MSALEGTINSLRSLLADRERQLTNLEADLAVARSASGCSQRLVGKSGQSESALRVEVDVLRRRLSEKEAQIVSSEERLSRLEAVHRLAQVCQFTRSFASINNSVCDHKPCTSVGMLSQLSQVRTMLLFSPGTVRCIPSAQVTSSPLPAESPVLILSVGTSLIFNV